ncbi:YbfB/YjiJ family MFS transporter [Enterobacteriaceae bacterium RIT697]|uniref:YbfB/YjiJ family MFS transporter n=1 Tax=Pantoea endophytica TaxID=92488 RepID=UPI0012ADD9B9|nr:YbfB/YjiJ family MFS transporter [Pantoea endophytica]MRT24934.1 YbfB/YjiJ family MFS transporter [Enterobacteriaceae bacterium RIT697]
MSIKSISTGHESAVWKKNSLITMLTGMITLIVVMGMGRFSLTPQIPLMIADGHLTLSSAGILAAMNYIGYLLGAVHVSRIRAQHARYLKTGLLATALVTFLSGFSSAFILQCLFRFVAGVGGAWALIIVTSWTQMILATYRAPRMSAAVFTGPGIGITLTGLLAWIMAGHQLHADKAWQVYGGVALAGALLVWKALPADLPVRQESQKDSGMSRELRVLLLAYTLAGFGYILPATFLSQMAHSIFAQGELAAFFWPLFGLSAVAGVLLVIAFAARFNTRNSLAVTMILQGMGVSAVVFLSNASGLLISTVVTGLAFLAIMQLSMKLAREVTTGTVAKTVAVLTSGYATGQLIGPLVSSISVSYMGSLQPALLTAGAGLVIAGLLVILGIRSPVIKRETSRCN